MDRLSGRFPALAALALLAAAQAVPAQEAPATPAERPVTVPAQERLALYEAFLKEFSAGNYAAALPRARELVEWIEANEPLSDELPTAYNNLGVVQFRTDDVAGAEASFSRALDLLEQTQGIASRRLVSPLAGLGAVYAAQDQHARAVDVLQRAIGISRRADGLFNLDQLDLLDAVIRSYEALGVYEGIEREMRYQQQIVQQQHGVDDPRTLPVTMKLAAWYERTNRFGPARALWAHTVEVASKQGGGRNAASINGLLGIARTHRLQYSRDPGSMEGAPPIDPLTGRPDPMFGTGVRLGQLKLDREGETAALKALEILDSTSEPPRGLLARTLIELGDWYTTAHEPEKAAPHYERAWPLVDAMLAPGEINPLLAPRALHYRAPAGATRNLALSDVPTVSRKIEFSLDIAATGEVTGVTPVSSEIAEGQTTQVARSLARAWFSPRLEDGKPVATSGFLFTEYWHEIAPAEAPSEAPAATPPEARPAADGKPAGSA